LRRASAVVESIVSVPPREKLGEILELLVRWNRRFNLVSRASDPGKILADALVDAAALTLALEAGGGKVADLGAGAGLVSWALSFMMPETELVLVEANARKAGFLRRVAGMLSGKKGGFTIVNTRLEEIKAGPLWRAAFSRAVWPPAQGWRLAAPHLAPGGSYTILAGPGTPTPRGWGLFLYQDLFPDCGDYSARRLLRRSR